MTTGDGREFIGRAQRAEGKKTTIQLQRGNLSGTVERIRIMGREELTGSERARDEFVLLVLRGERTLDESLFIRLLWFTCRTNLQRTNEVVRSTHLLTKTLNESQRSVVGAMLAEQLPLVITHGKFDSHDATFDGDSRLPQDHPELEKPRLFRRRSKYGITTIFRHGLLRIPMLQ